MLNRLSSYSYPSSSLLYLLLLSLPSVPSITLFSPTFSSHISQLFFVIILLQLSYRQTLVKLLLNYELSVHEEKFRLGCKLQVNGDFK